MPKEPSATMKLYQRDVDAIQTLLQYASAEPLDFNYSDRFDIQMFVERFQRVIASSELQLNESALVKPSDFSITDAHMHRIEEGKSE